MRLTEATLVLLLAGVPLAAQAQQINGAGATFPAPVYAKWGEAAKAAIGIELNYQAHRLAAAARTRSSTAPSISAPPTPRWTAKLHSDNLLQFPTVMGAVVPIVNLPGIEPDQLKLTGELIADIYLGKITKWNDPRIVELNAGLKLPNLAIAPVYRADGVGHDVRVHLLPFGGQPGMEDQRRRQHQREVAGRQRRARQRRRGRRR